MQDAELSDLVGKTMRRVVRDGDAIRFVSKGEEQWHLIHQDECCESVYIEDIVGDLDDLVGSPILMAEVSTNSDTPKPQQDPDESFTWSFYKLATVKGYVTIRWYGSSNGYYSETVSLLKSTWVPRCLKERYLFIEVVAGSQAAREVYADWLEDRGDIAQAMYVRDSSKAPQFDTALSDWTHTLSGSFTTTQAS